MTRGSTILLRLWGALLLAAALVMGPLPLFTFGLMAFGALFVLWLKGGRRRSGWRADAAEDRQERDERDAAHAHWVNGAVLLLCAVWFLLNVAVEIARVVPVGDPDRLMVLLMAVAFVFPPLIMHGGFVESGGEARAAPKGLLPAVYATALAVSVSLFLMAAGVLNGPSWITFPAAPLLLVALIAAAAAAGARRPSGVAPPPPEAPRPRRYWPFIMVAAAATFVLVVSVLITGGLSEYAERLSVVMRSLPVLMLFMASYYEQRFEFFDVFVKKSTLFFVLLLLLFAYFSLILPTLEARSPRRCGCGSTPSRCCRWPSPSPGSAAGSKAGWTGSGWGGRTRRPRRSGLFSTDSPRWPPRRSS